MKKVVVDQSKCIRCGMCMATAPETFISDENGFSKVINDEVNDDAIRASEACPTFAISIVNDSECHCEEECHCNSECHCNEEEN